MTLREAITEAATSIARREAETLLAHVLFRDRAWLIAHSDTELSSTVLSAYRALIARRLAKEPLQHLTGTQEFYGLPLRVTRDTLIPRPETEQLVEAVLLWITARPHLTTARTPLRVLDVGTGTGAIALALATHLPNADISATDISPAALSVAEHNAGRLHLGHRIHFIPSDLLTAPQFKTAAPFDVIVSNPPYISIYEAATLQPEVMDHEPHLALFAGPSGLDIYRRLIPAAHAALRPGGLLALEFGYGQTDALAALFQAPRFPTWQNLRFQDDYAGIPRIALAIRP
jgi:release factor glutamine methyltransferase